MRMDAPRVIAFMVAIAITIWFLWYYPQSILNLGIAPTGMPLREFYQARTVADLPTSIQALMNYQYPIAALFAIASFGAIDFGLTLPSDRAGIVLIGGFIPIAAFILFPLILLSVLAAFLFLIRVIWLYKNSDRSRLIPYLFCFAVNAIGSIGLWFHLKAVFAIIA